MQAKGCDSFVGYCSTVRRCGPGLQSSCRSQRSANNHVDTSAEMPDGIYGRLGGPEDDVWRCHRCLLPCCATRRNTAVHRFRHAEEACHQTITPLYSSEEQYTTGHCSGCGVADSGRSPKIEQCMPPCRLQTSIKWLRADPGLWDGSRHKNEVPSCPGYLRPETRTPPMIYQRITVHLPPSRHACPALQSLPRAHASGRREC